MLGKRNAAANLAVKDLPAARHFYENTLGLEPIAEEGEELVTYRSGDSVVNVYRSEFAGSNQATALTWDVGDDIENCVRQLKDKGIRFERYDVPDLSVRDDIYSNGDMKVAWFKDPDGNILNLVGH